ncbi:acyclic terpene utilization AtuA family protein [Mycobacterium sp. shizuoka-1]|uniref:acyclic terpene utilization AtuA family protein n=1 Tax=Mycobacterium sp. shizuoka-1 TaxID=2039281 RepID=UPI000C06DA06|nr:acyclic terpene utilization AtuA family protein [Mycobacterium sp. shizuoka-1]
MTRAVRIGNVSAFYGDRLSAMRDLVERADIDVITGDYLAELTMLILWKARQKDPNTGYARTFLTQFEQVMLGCAQRGIKVVVNAGGLNPAGMAEAVRALVARSGVTLSVAHVEGDDLMPSLDRFRADGVPFAHLDTGRLLNDAGVQPVTANAYLGGWGIAAALSAGADVVITGRVTDAALVVGVGAWWHGWERTDYDALAGAVAAGHIIECGPQATGGNYSQLHEVTDRRYPGSPIAELARDGSFVITKAAGTGGVVSPGTVTAQLLYEVASPRYANPDVMAHFDSLTVSQQGPDRVLVAGTTGSPPPPTLKVAMNYVGGYRNTMTMVLTGLDIQDKADWAVAELFEILGGRDTFDDVDVQLLRYDKPDPTTMAQATAHLRVTVKDRDRTKVDRAFSNAVVELYVAGYPGFHTTTPPTSASEFGVYWPTLVPATLVEHIVVHADGSRQTIPQAGETAEYRPEVSVTAPPTGPIDFGPTCRLPLGTVTAARSGDKGGNANVGVWTDTDERWEWLRAHLTVDRLRELVTETQGLQVLRYEFANLRALNFVIVGFLGEGVASCTRPDPQAKALGEYLRALQTDIPDKLVQ